MNTKYSLVKVNKYNQFYYKIILAFIIIVIFIYLYKKIKRFESFSYNLGVCSKNCCSTQWQVPENIREKDKIDPNEYNSKYTTSNMTCNDGIKNTGCVCLTEESKKLLSNRGYSNLSFGNGLLNEDDNISGMNNFSGNKLPIDNNIIFNI